MPAIKLKLIRLDGVPKLCVEAQQEHKHTVTQVKGSTYSKKYDAFFYPLSAIFHFFALPLPDGIELEYADNVYDVFDEQRKQYEIASKLMNGEIEPDEHTFLMRHQRVARKLAEMFDRFALFMDTGTGKTLTGLQIMEDKGGKWMVVVPRPIIRTGWMADAMDFFPKLKMFPASTNYNKERLVKIAESWGWKNPSRHALSKLYQMMLVEADIVVINPESTKKVIDMSKKLGVVYDGFFIDESTKIKNHKAQITKLITEQAYLRSTKYFYVATGDPRPQSEEDYFPQMYVIDPVLLGNNFYEYRGTYFSKFNTMGFDKYTFRISLREKLAKLIAMKSYTVKKEDCLDLKEPVFITREVELSAESKRLYKEMFNRFYMTLREAQEDPKSVEAFSKTASLMKVRQIISGFVIDNTKGLTHRTGGREKINELLNIVEELGDRPVVIWITFKEEAEMVADALGRDRCAIANSKHDTDEAVDKFLNNDVQFLIAHPASLKYGVTLTGRKMVKNCSYTIYFSMDSNYENYNQSKDRVQRYGQTEVVTYIHIIAEDTIDEDIYKSVMNKQTLSEMFSDIITKYAKGV